MRHLWNRLTLECYRQPGDTDKAPWYAYPLTVLFIVGLYAFASIGEAVGF